VTVWGVKVQAPWNIPNTDGFDIHASNVTVYDTTVSNGDQEIAFGSNGKLSTNITVDHFNGYSKGGITILASGTATSNLLVFADVQERHSLRQNQRIQQKGVAGTIGAKGQFDCLFRTATVQRFDRSCGLRRRLCILFGGCRSDNWSICGGL
jgi:hypothetical protein